MPAAIQNNLQARECTIPQPVSTARLDNAIRGHFRNRQQTDWAVVCDHVREKTTEILVYWNADPTHVYSFGKSPIAKENDCWVALGIATKDFVMVHYRAYGGPVPPPINHEGIDVGLCEKASVVSYWYRGKWLSLTGAD